MSQIKLTEYSHGAGCGCKIAPALLDDILNTTITPFTDPRLLVAVNAAHETVFAVCSRTVPDTTPLEKLNAADKPSALISIK